MTELGTATASVAINDSKNISQKIAPKKIKPIKFSNWVPAVIFYGILLLLWEISYQLEWIRWFILPGPSLIGDTIAENWSDLWNNTFITIREIFMGFALGSLIGFMLALGIFYSKILRAIIYPGVVFLQTVPKVALAPLFIIWFGTGETSNIAIAALICLFPVLVNTVVGFEGVDVNLLEMMHSVSANGWQKFRMIYLPASLPEIFAGLEVGISLAVIGAIVGEFISARAGLGYQIMMAQGKGLATDEVFAALVFISIIGMLFYFLVRLLGRIVVGKRANTRAARAAG